MILVLSTGMLAPGPQVGHNVDGRLGVSLGSVVFTNFASYPIWRYRKSCFDPTGSQRAFPDRALAFLRHPIKARDRVRYQEGTGR
jgi:hypothetical protein